MPNGPQPPLRRNAASCRCEPQKVDPRIEYFIATVWRAQVPFASPSSPEKNSFPLLHIFGPALFSLLVEGSVVAWFARSGKWSLWWRESRDRELGSPRRGRGVRRASKLSMFVGKGGEERDGDVVDLVVTLRGSRHDSMAKWLREILSKGARMFC